MATAASDIEAPLDREFAESFAHRWGTAWNERDGAGLAELCTEDIEFFDPAIGTIHGRRAVAEWLETCVRAFPDYRFEEPEPPYVSSDRAKVIAPWRMLATHTGPMDPPGYAPTGRAVDIEGVDHWWFRDGLLCRYRADYDSMDVGRQLGLIPARGSRAERSMAALQRLGARVRRR